MQIKILGTIGNIKIRASGHNRHSGILIDNKILLDLGEPEYLKYGPELVLITHLHNDHAFFVKDRNIKFDMPIYIPEKFGHTDNIRVISGPIRFKEYLITPLPVLHSHKVKSVGYLVEKGAKRFFYSGDVAGFNPEQLNNFGKLDLVITEASFFKKGGMIMHRGKHPYGHLGVPDLIDMFKNYTDRIIFTHFGGWFVKDTEEGTKKLKSFENKGLKVEIPIDGQEYLV